MQQDLIHDNVVIGGGPAGAAAAITLAQAGQPVCLLERKRAAHDKICGEFISWEATQILRDLGLDLAALGAQPVRRVALYSGEDTIASPLPFVAWSLSRRSLDSALLRQAEIMGVDVRRGVVVRELSRSDDGWCLGTGGKTSKGSEPAAVGGAQSKDIRASTVFLGSGKHDLRAWRRTSGQAGSRNLIGLKMHLLLAPTQQQRLRETVEIYLFDGGYAGLEMIEGGRANLCFLINKDIYSACNKHWPDVLTWLSGTSPHLKARLSGARSLWRQPLAIYGVPYGYLHSPAAAVPGLYRLGDQAAVIPSLAGDGIAIALFSGALAARVHLAGGGSEAYQQQALKAFEGPVRSAQALSRLFSGAIGRKAAFSLARLWPGLVQSAISHTRMETV